MDKRAEAFAQGFRVCDDDDLCPGRCGGDQLGQGKENSRKFLLENPKIAKEIEQRIMVKLGVGAEAKAQQAREAKAIIDAAVAADAAETKAAASGSGPVLPVVATAPTKASAAKLKMAVGQ